MDKSRKKLIRYVDRNIDEIDITERRRILNIIAENCGCDILYEENTGVRLRYSDLDDELLKTIKKRIIRGKKKTALILINSDSEDRIDRRRPC